MSPVRCGDTHWHIRADLRHELLDDGGLRRSDWEQKKQMEVVKTGAHREVIRVQTRPRDGFTSNITRSAGPKPLFAKLHPSRQGRVWNNAWRHASAHWVLRRLKRSLGRKPAAYGLVWDNYLITREIPDTQPLDGFLRTQFSAMAAADASLFRRRLAVELGQFTGKLHDAGVVHRDFHAGNILIRDRPGESIQLWLIDLHCAHIQESLSLDDAQKIWRCCTSFSPPAPRGPTVIDSFAPIARQRGLSGAVRSMAREVQAHCSRAHNGIGAARIASGGKERGIS